jgi:hypothetical protein
VTRADGRRPAQRCAPPRGTVGRWVSGDGDGGACSRVSARVSCMRLTHFASLSHARRPAALLEAFVALHGPGGLVASMTGVVVVCDVWAVPCG